MGSLSLSAPEVDRLREIVELCRCPPGQVGESTWAALEALQLLVGCDFVALNAMDSWRQAHHHMQGVADGQHWLEGGLGGDESDQPFWLLYPDCASCSYPERAVGPLIWSHEDFFSEREWREHPMHRDFLVDVVDELVMSFPDGPGRTVRLLFPRSTGQPFGEREKFLLGLLQPHLRGLTMAACAPPPAVAPALTPRQWDVLELVRTGIGNKQIARELGVSVATVRKHLENTYGRLDVQSRGAAVHLVFDSTSEQHPT